MSISADTHAEVRFEQDGLGRLVLIDSSGTRHVGAQAVRGFPISDPDHWISICDVTGQELVIIADPSLLDAASHAALDADLTRREFVPVIQRILRMPADTEPTDWDVETDRGRTRLALKSRDDVRRLGPDRALVVDAQGTRYLIESISARDSLTRRVLERYL